MIPLLHLALAEYVTHAGPHATAAGWVAHVKDATSLRQEDLIDIYNRRLAQQRSFIQASLFRQQSHSHGISIS